MIGNLDIISKKTISFDVTWEYEVFTNLEVLNSLGSVRNIRI